jgi:hypothetical protein
MRYGVVYNVFINALIMAVILLNIIIMIKFTRRSVYEGFMQNSKSIHRMVKIHRLYVIMWTAFQISSFIFVFFEGFGIRIVHGIIVVASPFIICTTMTYSIILSRRLRKKQQNVSNVLSAEERQTLLFEKVSEDLGAQKGRKAQHLIDSLLILNPKGSREVPGKEKLYINPEEKAFKFEPNTGYWDISDNFKEVLRREVVEYIVKAFDTLFELKKRDNEDVMIAKATMIDLNPRKSNVDQGTQQSTG